MGCLKTEKKASAVEARWGVAAPERKSRGTRVRTRCSGRALGFEVETQLADAMPQIVRATVEQAKKGSLIHTKWLWEKAEQSLKRKDASAAAKARMSLAELLMKQLNEGE